MAENFLKLVFNEAGMLLTDAQEQAFVRFHEMLVERNKVMNLTAITEYDEAAVLHYADSCMLFAPVMEDARKAAGITASDLMIDIGTGAGFPGLPLKILQNDLTVVLMDALQKRVDFLKDVVTTLDLDRTAPVHARAEEGVLLTMDEVFDSAVFKNQGVETGAAGNFRESFDLAVSRAVSALPVLSEYCLPFVKTGGCFAAYKSGDIDEELKNAENALKILGGEIISVEKFSLPVKGDSRSIVLIKKVAETPKKYPRKAGKPAKSPL